MTQGELANARSRRGRSAPSTPENRHACRTDLASKANAADVTTLGGDLNGVKSDLETHQERPADGARRIRHADRRNHDEIDQLRRMGERDYYEFTVNGKGQRSKVGNVPLELRGTDTKKNQFTVALYVDDMRLEKKNRSVDEPIYFYTRGSSRPAGTGRQQVGKNQVTGYLSVPKTHAAARDTAADLRQLTLSKHSRQKQMRGREGSTGPPIFFCRSLANGHWYFARASRRVLAVLAARFQYDASGTNSARCPSKPFLPVARSRRTKRFADAVILVEDGKIAAVGRRDQVSIPAGARRYDARALTVAPGFVDVHIHGAGGHDVMEGTAEALDAVTRTVARHGTTSLVATTVTASAEQTCRAVAGIAHWMKSQAASRTGDAHRAPKCWEFTSRGRSSAPRGEAFIRRNGSCRRLRNLLQDIPGCRASGTGRILTLAPELPGALELISAARAAGLVVSLGHTDASYARSHERHRARRTACGARLQRHAAVRAPRNRRDWRGAHVARGDRGTDRRRRARGRGGDAFAAGRQRAARRDSGERRHVGHGHAGRQPTAWALSM